MRRRCSTASFSLTGQQVREPSTTRWQQPWGEWRTIRNHYNELSLSFEEKSKLHSAA